VPGVELSGHEEREFEDGEHKAWPMRAVAEPLEAAGANRVVTLDVRAGSGNLNNPDKWKFCLNAA